MDNFTGKILDGRYRIEGVIGVGGMAVVYKAVDMQVSRTVAIKILKQEYMSDAQFKRRFVTESKAVSMLSHDNIVKVYDVGFGNDLYYIVMEYIDGITLKQFIEQQGALRWKETVFFTTQILRALRHAHAREIIHRDIKPQNIMLLQDGTIKVTDFGIARFSNSNTATMTDKAIGSVHYISPEQVSGGYMDMRSDIYSVGVLMYEMLTGKLPFDAENPVSIAIMQLQTAPRMPREQNPSIPEGLEEITMRAMAKDPAMRYMSAEQMIEDLERFKLNPSIRFEYKYFVDDKPTRYVESIRTVQEEQQPEPAPQNSVRRSFVSALSGILAAFLVVAGLVLVVIFVVLPSISNGGGGSTTKKPEDVDVPKLVGEVYDDMVAMYKDTFKFHVTAEVPSDKYDEGVIMSQDPVDGMKIKEGATINVTVSKGAEENKMPDLVNKDAMQSRITLQNQGFTVKYGEDYKEFHDTITKGYVTRTEPAAGADLRPGQEIIIYESMGPEVLKTEVPDIRGMPEADAIRALLGEKLVVGKVTKENSDTVDAGEVISQDPAPGGEVDEGMAINYVVSLGPETTTTAPDTTTAPTSDDTTAVPDDTTSSGQSGKTIPLGIKMYDGVNVGETFMVKITLDGVTVYNEQHTRTEDSTFTVHVTASGMKLVQVYIDGSGEDYVSQVVNFDN